MFCAFVPSRRREPGEAASLPLHRGRRLAPNTRDSCKACGCRRPTHTSRFADQQTERSDSEPCGAVSRRCTRRPGKRLQCVSASNSTLPSAGPTKPGALHGASGLFAFNFTFDGGFTYASDKGATAVSHRKLLPSILAGWLVVEMPISAKHFDFIAPRSPTRSESEITEPFVHSVVPLHIESEITEPLQSCVSTVSVGIASVVYISACLRDKNGGRPGHMTEPVRFSSTADAMHAPLPTGYESALLTAPEARYSYSSIWRWQPC